MAPRSTKAASHGLPLNTLVLDNGAYTIKAGYAPVDGRDPDPVNDCHVFPNCVARGYDARRHPKYYVADELDSCRDFEQMGFRRPVEKGFVVNWDTEMDIWKQAFFRKDAKLPVDPHTTNLILTEAPNCPLALQSNADQMIFEEFEFASYARLLAPSLPAYDPSIPSLFNDPEPHRPPPAECLLVIDSGYSHTTITPIISGKPVKSAMRRLDIGGKFLSAALAELISVRHYDLRAEPYQIDHIKESVSFVSQDFAHDLERTWKSAPPRHHADARALTLEYVLPDWHHTFQGTIRPYDPAVNLAKRLADRRADPGLAREKFAKLEDSFPLCNERFAVPELLFRPADIGMAQAGLPEAVVQVLAHLPRSTWPGFLANVLVVGGTSKIPGFVDRLHAELRPLLPADIPLRVRQPPDPVKCVWLGGARLAMDKTKLRNVVVTREEYLENGAPWATRKFNGAASGK